MRGVRPRRPARGRAEADARRARATPLRVSETDQPSSDGRENSPIGGSWGLAALPFEHVDEHTEQESMRIATDLKG